jgi:hypothetical protein
VFINLILASGHSFFPKIGGKAPMHVCNVYNRDMARSICWDKSFSDLKFVDLRFYGMDVSSFTVEPPYSYGAEYCTTVPD